MANQNLHENFAREERTDGSSDRGFGLVFSAVFLILALWPLIHGESVRWWSLWLASLFALIAIVRPSLLAGLNKVWIRLGLILGAFVSPVALGIVFFLVVTPIGVLMRLVGADPLRLKFDRAASSYWIKREPPGPKPDSLTNQF